MMDQKLELSDIRVAEQDGFTSPKTEPGNESITDSQTRTRKLFSYPQLLAFAFMYFITWIGMGT